MAQPNQQFSIKGTAFQGVNTEFDPIGGDLSFALRADNCVVDRVGRIAARECFRHAVDFQEGEIGDYGNVDVSAISACYSGKSHHVVCTALLGTYYPESKPVVRIDWNSQEEISTYEFDPDMPYTYGLFWDDGNGLKRCSYPSANGLERSLYVHFKDDLYLFAKGMPFMKYDCAGSWTPVDHTPPPTIPAIDGDIAISAYGRLWVAGVDGDYQTIHYSSLLREDLWYDPTAEKPGDNPEPDKYYNDGGVINVSEYWPVEYDEIVNIHAHNGLLIIFGRQSILLYGNAGNGDPAGENGLFLQDAISYVGLVERDALCNIGTDVVFCDDTGIRSLGRVIQEKSNPVSEPSLNVKRDFMEMMRLENESSYMLKGIKLCYFPNKSLFVALFSSLGMAYAFSTDRLSTTGGAKVTRWTECDFACMHFAETISESIPYLGGRKNLGVMKYSGFDDSGAFEMRFESMALGVSGGQMIDVFSKSIIYLLSSDAIPVKAKALWGFGGYLGFSYDFTTDPLGSTYYNVAEWGIDEYIGPNTGVWRNKVNTMGSGTFLRVGMTAQIENTGLAIQEIAVNTAVGRLVA